MSYKYNSILKWPIPKLMVEYRYLFMADANDQMPQIRVLNNTLGTTPVWSRDGIGLFRCNTFHSGLPPAFSVVGRVGGQPYVTNANQDGPVGTIPLTAQSETTSDFDLVGHLQTGWWNSSGIAQLYVKRIDLTGNLTDSIHINPIEFALHIYVGLDA